VHATLVAVCMRRWWLCACGVDRLQADNGLFGSPVSLDTYGSAISMSNSVGGKCTIYSPTEADNKALRNYRQQIYFIDLKSSALTTY
jgi:hypothetical protein